MALLTAETRNSPAVRPPAHVFPHPGEPQCQSGSPWCLLPDLHGPLGQGSLVLRWLPPANFFFFFFLQRKRFQFFQVFLVTSTSLPCQHQGRRS